MKTFIQAIANLLGVDISETGNKKIFVRIIFIASQFIVLLLLLAIYLWSFQKDGTFGQIGDFFNGILGPFLSLITILLVYATYRVQKEELKATLEELRKTAESMQDQKKIMEMQELTQRITRCDSTVFKMFETYKETYEKKEINKELIMLIKKAKEGFYAKVKGFSDHDIEYYYLLDGEENLQDIQNTFNSYFHDPNKQNEYFEFLFEYVKKSRNRVTIFKTFYQLVSVYMCPFFSGIQDSNYYSQMKFYLRQQLSLTEFLFFNIVVHSMWSTLSDDKRYYLETRFAVYLHHSDKKLIELSSTEKIENEDDIQRKCFCERFYFFHPH